MKKTFVVLAAMVATIALASAPGGAGTALMITSVSSNGSTVTVKGVASIPRVAAAKINALRADAGDTLFLAAGDQAALMGTARGGRPPYSFSWSSPVGELDGARSPTALIDTKGVKGGAYAVRLTVKDAAGAVSRAASQLLIEATHTTTLLKQDKSDPTPGVTGTGTVTFTFQVPAHVQHFDVRVTWDNSANDYDLTVVDPNGNRTSGSQGGAGEPETASIDEPIAGTWMLSLDKFTTVGDTLHALVTGIVGQDDPRPTVSAGGPYRFLIGATQRLAAAVTGGAKPYTIGWDTNDDGAIDARGATVTTQLPEGRNLVTAYVRDAHGLVRRQTTSVLVATKERLRLDTAAVTVIGIADTGLNPYHLEYSAATYPDPDVLALTHNFTRPPSEYIPGYPSDAQPIPITLGKGYFPPQDKRIWDGNTFIKPGKLYWIPGTKIIGAISSGPADGSDGNIGTHPILDDEGHGSGTTSVAAGNRYGYCPTCLLVIVEGLNTGIKEAFPWVDISSNSFGPVAGLPTALTGSVLSGTGPDLATKAAVERGQIDLFAAGNGLGNFFDVPQADWGESDAGMPWNIVVGALRRDNQRAVFGDGIPVHISAWGDGDLPSACRTGMVSQCAFGGTSAATPYTAGVFGTVLSQIRRELGDVRAGQKPHQVVAEGVAIPGSPYLSDGKLTREELRDVVLKTAEPLNTDNSVPDPYVHPVWTPYIPYFDVLMEGYGAATPNGAQRAIDVLMGKAPIPDRSFEDQFFQIDEMIKEQLYGSYDKNGDGKPDPVSAPSGFHVNSSEMKTYAGQLAVLQRAIRAEVREAPSTVTVQPRAHAQDSFSVTAQPVSAPSVFYLHRLFDDPETTPSDATPGLLPPVPPGLGVFIPSTTTVRCNEADNVFFMDTVNTSGDLDPCFNSRVSSTIANFRPLGLWPTSHPIAKPLPAGSTIRVELYIAGETPSIVQPTGVLVATDREIGSGAGTPNLVLGSGINGPLCDALGSACWTRYDWSFTTTRPAFRGEELTFQVQLVGARSWAFGYEGDHASRVTIEPAPMPASGLGFGVTILGGSGATAGQKALVGGTVTFPDLGSDPTGAGDHPAVRTVQVSVDDPSFADPILADIDTKGGTWSLDLGSRSSAGVHAVFARAAINRTYSNVATSMLDIGGSSVVQWQITRTGAAPVTASWHTASGFSPWSITFPATSTGTLHVRVLAAGLVVAQTSLPVDGSVSLPATGVGTPSDALVFLAAGLTLAAWRRRRTTPA